MYDSAIFKEQFPTIWRAAMEHRHKKRLCDVPDGSATAPVGADPAARLETPEPGETGSGRSLQFAITACDGDAIAIRIARDGDGFTATVELDRHPLLDRVEGEAR